jgi:hypothetical protein
MVKIEIDDRVCNAYRVRWALDDVTEHNEVVRKLELEMLEISIVGFIDVKRNLEAWGLQEISLKDYKRYRNENDT